MSVSGVRSSWLTLAKKSDLAMSSSVRTSVRRRSSSRCRMPLKAIATWEAHISA